MARMDLLRHKDDDFYCRLIVIETRWNSLNKSGSLILEFGILVLESDGEFTFCCCGGWHAEISL